MIVKSATLKIRGGVERDSHGNKAGKGALIQWEKSATLGVSQDQTLFIWIEDEDNINRQMESGCLRGADVDTSYHRRNGRKRCDTGNNDNL